MQILTSFQQTHIVSTVDFLLSKPMTESNLPMTIPPFFLFHITEYLLFYDAVAPQPFAS